MSYSLWPTVLVMKNGRIIGDALSVVGGPRLIMALYPRPQEEIYPQHNSQSTYIELPYKALQTQTEPGIGWRAFYVDITAVPQTRNILVKGPIPPFMTVPTVQARGAERLPNREHIEIGESVETPPALPQPPPDRMLEL